MALKGISSLESEEYICREDPCRTREEGATVFLLQNISSAKMAQMGDMQSVAKMEFGQEGQTYLQRTSARNREAFKFGVKGWDNFLGDDGQPIQFKSEQWMEGGRTYMVVSDESLDRVPLSIINEVGQHVYNLNALTEAGRKKFEQVSLLLGGSDTSDATTAPPKTRRKGAAKATQ